MSDDVERLTAELALAKKCEKLEAAREALHADRNDETVAAYQRECDKVAAARADFRSKWRVQPGPGDAAPLVETVTAAAEARLA